jgi:hypothetical protein
MKTGDVWRSIRVLALVLATSLCHSSVMASPVAEAAKAIAGRLKTEQAREGPEQGTWPQEEFFTGLMVVGMVDAYETTGDPAYLASAELGGYYILANAGGNFFGDEALALARLSVVKNDPNDYVWGTSDNIWGLSLKMFYAMIKSSNLGTEGYISSFAGADPSLSVLYMADYTVAAYIVDAEDREVWRLALIDRLSALDDQARYPVMALGAATWALAATGPSLDQTVIDPCGLGASYWKLKKLEDLPGLLLSHQVPSGQPSTGGFYWRFDHSNAGLEGMEPSGYTEDAIFATLGLLGAYGADPNGSDPNLTAAIRTASDVLTGSVTSSGKVWERLSQQGAIYYAYGAEMLRVLRRLPLVAAEPDPNAPPVSAELAAAGNGRLWSVPVQSSGSGQLADYERRRMHILNW